MLKNFLLLFGVSIIGLALAYRTARTSELNRITGIQSTERALSMLGIAIEVLIIIIFPAHFVYVLIIPPAMFVVSGVAKKLILQRRNSQFRSEFERFLDVVILEMRTGCSYRISLERARTRSTCPFFQERIQMLLQSLTYVRYASMEPSESLPKNIANFFRRMAEIDVISHRQIPRLQTFRQQLRLESEFRHRSGQATRQARAQAWILVGLYLALLVFVLGHFRFTSLSRMVGLSAILMLVGAVCMQKMGHKKKWNV